MKRFYLSRGCLALTLTLVPLHIGCPTIERRVNFSFVDRSGQEKLLPAELLIPNGLNRPAPVVIISPGYTDSAAGQLPLAGDLAEKSKYIVIVPDFDDYLNLLPFSQRPVGDSLISVHLDQLLIGLDNLAQELESLGLDLPTDTPEEMVDWFQNQALTGVVDDEQILEICRDIFYDRRIGIESILHALTDPAGPLPTRLIDTDRVALLGHSAGGLTSLELAEGAIGCRIKPKTVVAIAPTAGLLTQSQMSQIEIPILWLLGSLDEKLTVNGPSLVRASWCADSEIIEVEGASHLTFSALGRWVETLSGYYSLNQEEVINQKIGNFLAGHL